MFKNTDLLPQTSPSSIIGQPFKVLPQVESTNNYAMALAHEGLATDGMAVFTSTQTAGKGQRGKAWQSAAGENIALSVIIKPPTGITGFSLSALIALALREWYESYAKSEVFVKWPNDIYWRDRKAAGILIENIMRENVWHWAIIGIGVNLNQTQFDPELKNPVSLKQVTGRSYDPEQLAREICSRLEQYIMIQPPSDWLSLYNEHLYKRGQAVRLKKRSAVFKTIIEGVNASGELVTSDTVDRGFTLGEIEWLI